MATYAGMTPLKGDGEALILLSQSLQAAKAAQSARETMPHSQVHAAYAVFGLGAYFVFSHMAGGEFSAVLTLYVVLR